MNLIDRCLAGLELRDPSRNDPRPLDFVVTNERGTLLMLANWWTVSWGMDAGLIYVPAVVDPGSLRFLDLPDQDVRLGPPTDDLFAGMLTAARFLTDVQRGRYYRELQKLVEFEPDFDFYPWIETILARPTIDPLAHIRSRTTARRDMGIVRMRNAAASVVDVLVVDSLGQVATFQEGGWLALFAAQWAGYAEGTRPDIASFLGWLVQQRPYGPFSLDVPQVTQAEGELDAIVSNAVQANPTT